MLSVPFVSNAQIIQNVKTNEKVELKESVEKYCSVVMQQLNLKIDFYVGINELGFWQFIDDAGLPIKMKSTIDVMNFMYKNGWEYINNIGGSDGAAPQYFFKKKD